MIAHRQIFVRVFRGTDLPRQEAFFAFQIKAFSIEVA